MHELNARNASLSRLSSGEYIEDHYIQEGWFQDEHGEWCYDPALAFADATQQASSVKKSKVKAKRSESIKSSSSQSADKNKNAQMPSSNAMSDNIYDYDQSASAAVADNYDEGWYQDEYGNWLNQFDWKQVRH